MAGVVYVLCAATSLGVAVLLLRGYLQRRTKFLLWGGLCFLGLALNNVLVFVDLILVPQADLVGWRNLSALAGMLLLLHGLIWDSR